MPPNSPDHRIAIFPASDGGFLVITPDGLVNVTLRSGPTAGYAVAGGQSAAS
jgi:hypothetical protein